MDRTKRYKELLDFYHGRQWEGRERRGERRLIFNYAKVFIDKITSYLMSGINFAVDAAQDSDEARARAQKAEAALYRVYEENNLEQLDLETEIDCALLGDACYKVIWDTTEKKIRVTAPDVQGIYAWWWGDDTSRVWRANLTTQSLDLTADVIGARQELGETSGKLTVELRNDEGQYASPGQGGLTVLEIGCQLDFSPGYRTAAGNEVSSG